MFKVIIIKPRPFSNGVSALRDAFNIKRIKCGTLWWNNSMSQWDGNTRAVVNRKPFSKNIINWGCSNTRMDFHPGSRVINPPNTVKNASNKLSFFHTAYHEGMGTYLPRFYSSWNDLSERTLYVGRSVLNGSGGEGIIIGTKRELPQDLPLYTKYIKKKEEFRVHVGMNGTVIAVQRKGLRHNVDRSNEDGNLWRIRNHSRGFVFVRNDDYFVGRTRFYEKICLVASQTVDALGLDFGAVDLISRSNGSVYVLEVNTAPGLEGQTVQDYADHFQSVLYPPDVRTNPEEFDGLVTSEYTVEPPQFRDVI